MNSQEIIRDFLGDSASGLLDILKEFNTFCAIKNDDGTITLLWDKCMLHIPSKNELIWDTDLSKISLKYPRDIRILKSLLKEATYRLPITEESSGSDLLSSQIPLTNLPLCLNGNVPETPNDKSSPETDKIIDAVLKHNQRGSGKLELFGFTFTREQILKVYNFIGEETNLLSNFLSEYENITRDRLIEYIKKGLDVNIKVEGKPLVLHFLEHHGGPQAYALIEAKTPLKLDFNELLESFKKSTNKRETAWEILFEQTISTEYPEESKKLIRKLFKGISLEQIDASEFRFTNVMHIRLMLEGFYGTSKVINIAEDCAYVANLECLKYLLPLINLEETKVLEILLDEIVNTDCSELKHKFVACIKLCAKY